DVARVSSSYRPHTPAAARSAALISTARPPTGTGLAWLLLSVQGDMVCLHHVAPPLLLGMKERRERFRCAANGGKTEMAKLFLGLGILQCLLDEVVQLIFDFIRRALGKKESIPFVDTEARDARLCNGGNVRQLGHTLFRGHSQ